MKKTFVYVLCAALVALACVSPASLSTVEAAPTPKTPSAGPAISSITTNASSYLDGIVPRFARFEITFQVDTIAQNLQLPYDANPPPGVAPGVGVTVNALCAFPCSAS